MTRATMLISGFVQGVFYRGSAQQEAMRLGLLGEVRNLADGRVELIAEGDKSVIEKLAAWCRRGPSQARVDEVEVRWAAATGEFKTFRVAR
jgi:acylphosphatase